MMRRTIALEDLGSRALSVWCRRALRGVMAQVLLGEIAERAEDLDEAIVRFDKARKLVGDATADGAALKKRIDELKQKQKQKKADAKKR